MHGETVRFDESSRSSHSDQPVGPGGVASALREAAQAAGLDAPSELYNEALRFASEGRMPQARERLQMLLCLDPDDGEAHLLMAKVHVNAQEWTDALSALDRARTSGASVPATLRRAVEEHLRAEQASNQERTSALHAREEGEIAALRQEARRLRSENARLLGKVHDLGREVRRWAYGVIGLAAFSAVFVLANLVLAGMGAGTSSTVATDVAVTDATPATDGAAVHTPAVVADNGTPTAPVVAAGNPTPPASSALALQAHDALKDAAGLDGTALEVAVLQGKATVSGTVATHTQRKRAEDVLAGIPGIAEIDTSGVTVFARTKGTTHTVVSGDNLSNIAYAYYGDATLAKTILKANSKLLKGKPNLAIGMQLKVPAVE